MSGEGHNVEGLVHGWEPVKEMERGMWVDGRVTFLCVDARGGRP